MEDKPTFNISFDHGLSSNVNEVSLDVTPRGRMAGSPDKKAFLQGRMNIIDSLVGSWASSGLQPCVVWNNSGPTLAMLGLAQTLSPYCRALRNTLYPP